MFDGNEQSEKEKQAVNNILRERAKRMIAAPSNLGPDYQVTLDDIARMNERGDWPNNGLPDYVSDRDVLSLLAKEILLLKEQQ